MYSILHIMNLYKLYKEICNYNVYIMYKYNFIIEYCHTYNKQ